MFEKRILNLVLTITIVTGIGACSSTPKVQEFADTTNPADELQSFATDMLSANERQVDILSPSAYRQAKEALISAQQDQKNGEDAKTTLHSVARGRAQLNQANQFAELSRTNLEAVVSARQAALTAGARETYAEDFNKADDHLRAVTSDIENNNLGSAAANRDKLQKEYLNVEIKAIKQTNLGHSRETIAAAIGEGAKDYAKQSLAIAEKNVNDTDAFIVANPHQSDAIRTRSQEATDAANHLLKITRSAKAGENVSPEQAALRLESEQTKTQDERHQLNVERKTAKDLAVQTGDLKSDAAFNRKFESARNEFSSDEAEVYRQGNHLVIRLRSLEFPANQSVLRGSNFPLLAKVAKVVKEFKNSSVLIEGHTDSDGGKALNDKLSAERAQAISEYLISTDAVLQEKITVASYGFERPLASNKTAKGKAQNRRVDVVISPQTNDE
jgi:OmpA-OmpF porin, OOP family